MVALESLTACAEFALVVARLVFILSDRNNEVEGVTWGVIVEGEDGGDVTRQDVVETVTLHVEGELEHAGRLRLDRQTPVDQATAVLVERTAVTFCTDREVCDGRQVSDRFGSRVEWLVAARREGQDCAGESERPCRSTDDLRYPMSHAPNSTGSQPRQRFFAAGRTTHALGSCRRLSRGRRLRKQLADVGTGPWVEYATERLLGDSPGG